MGGGKTHLLVGFGLLAKYLHLRKKYCGGTIYFQAFASAKTAAFNGRNNPDHFFGARSRINLDVVTNSRLFGLAA